MFLQALLNIFRKRWLTFVTGALLVGFGWHETSAERNLAHHIGLSQLDFIVMDWYSHINVVLMLWGIFLAWRLFAGEAYARWDRELAAKFVIFAGFVTVPIFALTAFCGNLWPETLKNPDAYHDFIDAYAKSAGLMTFAVFFSNCISPGLVSSVVGMLIASLVALFGAFLESFAWVIFFILFPGGCAAVVLRPRFEAGTLRWGQRLSFVFMVVCLVVLPTVLTIFHAFISHNLIREQIADKIPGLTKELSRQNSASEQEIRKMLEEAFLTDGETSIYNKSRTFVFFTSLTLILGLAVFVKRFWGLQGKFETLNRRLAEKSSELEAILRGTKEGIIVADAQDAVVFVNQQFADMTGISVGEYAGNKFFERIRGAAHIAETSADGPVAKGDGGGETPQTLAACVSRSLEWKISRRNPEPEPSSAEPSEPSFRIFRLNCGAIPDGGGDVSAVVGVLHDMTLERRMTEAKNEFVRHVAHEFRTPLTSINAFTEMLLDSEVENPETEKEYLGIIYDETNRLMRMINELLDIARIESGRRELRPETIDVGARMKQITAIMDAQVKEKRQTLTLEIDERVSGLKVGADLFQQAVLNIIGNAVKYTPAEGTIRCRVFPADARLVIAVKDSGFGISPEDQVHLFEKFFRIRTEQTKNIVGTGLGLATVKSILEAHGGGIDVESRLGEGSTFSLSFPLA
ncbi:MAG: ATP-binding protein [Candidatus Ozemobacteraceae bacterium]